MFYDNLLIVVIGLIAICSVFAVLGYAGDKLGWK
jgi:hypothetical protein